MSSAKQSGFHDTEPTQRDFLAPEREEDDASSLFSSDSGYLMDLADASEDTETILPKTDFHSPYYVNVPLPSQSGLTSDYTEPSQDSTSTGFVREYPTDILLDRFNKWRKILKGLANYLREVAYAQERFARINYGLRSTVKFSFLTDLEESTNRVIDPFQQRAKKQAGASAASLNSSLRTPSAPGEESPGGINSSQSALDVKNVPMAPGDNSSASSGFMKFGSGSIEDIQVVLKKYHASIANQQIKMSKEITTVVVPKLDDLRKDLQLKIKEIKELHGDFRTNIGEHIALTGQLLQKYMAAVEFMSTNFNDQKIFKLKNQKLKPKHDPYLLKLQLDLQLKRQLLEENYLQEAYINLQSSGMELEKIIFGEVQHTLQRYSALIGTSARISISNLCNELHQGVLSKPPAIEWDHFVGHHPKCLIDWKSTEPIPQPRKLSDIRYPKMKSSLAKCIKAGYLCKKSQILKNYNKAYFVLTSNYLHEFKSSNFFKLSQENSEKKDHGEVQTGSKKRAMVPVTSLSLNSAQLLEASEHKFSIRGVTSYNNFEKKSAETGKIISKSTSSIHKFLKSGSKLQPHKKDQHHHGSIAGLPSGTGAHGPSEDLDDVATWVFKAASSKPEDAKDLKKWVTEVKNLSSFMNSVERAKFIEEKILRAHNRASSMNLSKMAAESGNNGRRQDRLPPHKVSGTRSKPQFIHLGPQEMQDPALARAKVNTPAIDDNGNLITAGERRSSSLKSPSEVPSPHLSPTPTNHSGGGTTPGSSGHGSDTPMKQQGFVITSNGITPINRTPGSASKRNVSGVVPSGGSSDGSNSAPMNSPGSSSAPVNSPGSNIQTNFFGSNNSPIHSPGSGILPLNSPASHLSGGSGSGGYFAIPVRPSSQASTPGLGNPDSTAAAAQTQGSNVPRLRVNDRDMSQEKTDKNLPHSEQSTEKPAGSGRPAEGGPLSRGAPVHLRKTSNPGGISTFISEPHQTIYSNPRQSLSSQTLGSTNHQHVRKHKKNVSFGSLNSLLFSKKGGDVSNNNMTDYFMSGNRIQENDDPDALNVNQSLYRS